MSQQQGAEAGEDRFRRQYLWLQSLSHGSCFRVGIRLWWLPWPKPWAEWRLRLPFWRLRFSQDDQDELLLFLREVKHAAEDLIEANREVEAMRASLRLTADTAEREHTEAGLNRTRFRMLCRDISKLVASYGADPVADAMDEAAEALSRRPTKSPTSGILKGVQKLKTPKLPSGPSVNTAGSPPAEK